MVAVPMRTYSEDTSWDATSLGSCGLAGAPRNNARAHSTCVPCRIGALRLDAVGEQLGVLLHVACQVSEHFLRHHFLRFDVLAVVPAFRCLLLQTQATRALL